MNNERFLEKYLKVIAKHNVLIFTTIFIFKILLFEAYIRAAYIETNPFLNLAAGIINLLIGRGLQTLKEGMFLVSFCSILLLTSIIILFSKEKRNIIYYVLDIILSILLFSDLIYFKYYKDFLNITVLSQLFQVIGLGGSIANLIRPQDFIFFLDLILLAPVIIFRLPKEENIITYTRNKMLGKIVLTIVLLLIGFFGFKNTTNMKLKTYGSGLLKYNFSSIGVYNTVGIVGYHGNDIYRGVVKLASKEKIDLNQEKQFINNYFKEKQYTTVDKLFGIAKGKNVIVIQAESLQQMVINKKIKGVEITPNLNKLVKSSMYFNNYYHNTFFATTADCELSSQTSMYPLKKGSPFILYPKDDYNSLPKILKSDGYDTAAFHGNTPSFWNRYIVYGWLKFNHFFDIEKYAPYKKVGMGVEDNEFLQKSIGYIKEQLKAPSYSTLITLSTHYPFEVDATNPKLDVSGFNDKDFENYIKAMNYLDNSLGNAIKKLKDNGLWDNSVVAIFGDHDNKINKKETLSKYFNKNIDDIDLKIINSKVPLIIHLPNNAEAKEYDITASQVDFTPTMLNILGYDYTKYKMMGRNIFENNDKVIFRDGSYIYKGMLYMPSNDGIYENGAWYDIKTKKIIKNNSFKAIYESFQKDLQISDEMLEHNIFN